MGKDVILSLVTDELELNVIWQKIRLERKLYIFDGSTVRDVCGFVKSLIGTEKTGYAFSVRYGVEIVGVVWLNRIYQKTARMHFCSFDNVSPRDKIRIGRKVLDMLLEMRDEQGDIYLENIEAFIPEHNKLAYKFAKLIGMFSVGRVSEEDRKYELFTYGKMSKELFKRR